MLSSTERCCLWGAVYSFFAMFKIYAQFLFRLSLVHCGPAPQFFSSAVAEDIIYGPSNVKARPLDVVDSEIREKIEKV